MLAYLKTTEKNADSMQNMVDRKVHQYHGLQMSEAMVQKITGSGLQLQHMYLAFSSGGLDCLNYLLSEM